MNTQVTNNSSKSNEQSLTSQTIPTQLSIHWGVMCEPISVQLSNQGISLSEFDANYLNKLKESCNQLTFILPDSLSEKVYKYAHKEVISRVKKSLNKKDTK